MLLAGPEAADLSTRGMAAQDTALTNCVICSIIKLNTSDVPLLL